MNDILSLINQYGVYIVFIVVLLEYACFPLPSEVVLPLSGGIAYELNISPFIMIFLCTIAGVIGTLLCYFIGYLGKNKLFNKFIKERERDESSSLYNKYGNLAISFGRLIPFCRTYISFIAGANRHNIVHYILFSLIGIILWNTILILLGYLFYDNLTLISTFYKDYKIILICIFSIILSIIIIKKIIKKFVKNKKNNYSYE